MHSAVPGELWPAIPPPAANLLLALQFQLEQSEWWTDETLRAHQLRQLAPVLAHAATTVSFYKDRLARFDLTAPLTWERFQTLPVLTRGELQAAGSALYSSGCPTAHGRISEGQSGGSTGMPVRYRSTELNTLFWQALTLRDHLWHGRDAGGKLAVMRANTQGNVESWGAPVSVVSRTGPGTALDVSADVAVQLDWLMRENPDYIMTYPSNLTALLRLAQSRGVKPSNLREARTFGELVVPGMRELCREVWQVPLTDLYSAEEVGYMALQCPRSENYHVQSENIIVEVLDEQGMPCRPGEFGRVVVTALHNFAMPLIRYEIGDYAEPAAPCACGRGLPALKRINGRRRNMLRLPDGSTHWPFFGFQDWIYSMPVRQVQFAQIAPEHIEVRMVAGRELTREEIARMSDALRASLGHPFEISVKYLDAIARSPRHKYEDFVSELS